MTIPNNPVPNEEWTNDVTGVTYVWDGERWFIKPGEDSGGGGTIDPDLLDSKVDVSVFENDQERQDLNIASNLTIIEQNVEAIDDVEGQVNTNTSDISGLDAKVAELEITKGSVAKYKVKQTTMGYASRDGELITNNANIESITFVSLAPNDNNGNPTKPVSIGDIVEFDIDGGIARFLVESGDSTQALTVVNTSGSGPISVNQLIDVYIYPQNKAGASQEYVDAQDQALKEYTDNELALKANESVLTQYVTTDYANRTYLRDGFTSNKLCINRTAGGSIDSMKVTNISGGATVWRLDCKAGSNGPVIYKAEGSAYHDFVGKVNIERVGDTTQGFCIKGLKTTGEEGELFYAYHNGGAVPDAVNYTGKMDSDNNIVNKKYVDDAVGLGDAGGGGLNPEDYLLRAGDTMEGTLDLKGEVLFELPNSGGGVSRMRLMRCHPDADGNGGNKFQFTTHPSSGGALSNSKIHIDISHTPENGPKTKLRWLSDPVQDDNAVNLSYANENYLQLSGGTLTNSLAFNRGNKASQQFGIEPNSSTSDTNIYVFNNGQMRLRSSHTDSIDDRVGSHIVLDPNGGSPLTKIYNVVEPTSDTMAANKLYVDNAVSGKLIPPGLQFDYVSSESTDVGQLAYFQDAGGLRMRLHKTSKDITWNQSGPISDVLYGEGHMFTVYNVGNSGAWNIIRTGTINRIDWHEFDILCYVSSHQTNGTFSTSKIYYVTIAGLF